VPTRDLWAGFPQDYVSLLHQWYCSLGQCCESGDCRITNNITGSTFTSAVVTAFVPGHKSKSLHAYMDYLYIQCSWIICHHTNDTHTHDGSSASISSGFSLFYGFASTSFQLSLR